MTGQEATRASWIGEVAEQLDRAAAVTTTMMVMPDDTVILGFNDGPGFLAAVTVLGMAVDSGYTDATARTTWRGIEVRAVCNRGVLASQS